MLASAREGLRHYPLTGGCARFLGGGRERPPYTLRKALRSIRQGFCLPSHPSVTALRRRQLPSVGEPLGGCRLGSLPCKGLRSRAPPAAGSARRSRRSGRRVQACFSTRRTMRAPQTGGGCGASRRRRGHCRLAWPISCRVAARKTTVCRAGVYPRLPRRFAALPVSRVARRSPRFVGRGFTPAAREGLRHYPLTGGCARFPGGGRNRPPYTLRKALRRGRCFASSREGLCWQPPPGLPTVRPDL